VIACFSDLRILPLITDRRYGRTTKTVEETAWIVSVIEAKTENICYNAQNTTQTPRANVTAVYCNSLLNTITATMSDTSYGNVVSHILRRLQVKCIQAHINTLFVVHFFSDHQFLEILAGQCQQPSALPSICHWTTNTKASGHKHFFLTTKCAKYGVHKNITISDTHTDTHMQKSASKLR